MCDLNFEMTLKVRSFPIKSLRSFCCRKVSHFLPPKSDQLILFYRALFFDSFFCWGKSRSVFEPEVSIFLQKKMSSRQCLLTGHFGISLFLLSSPTCLSFIIIIITWLIHKNLEPLPAVLIAKRRRQGGKKKGRCLSGESHSPKRISLAALL